MVNDITIGNYFAIYFKIFNFMKTLELNQMEELQAGSCAVDVGFAVASTVLISLGPVGWLAYAGLAVVAADFWLTSDCGLAQ